MRSGRAVSFPAALALAVACTSGTDLTGTWVAERVLAPAGAPAEGDEGPPGGGLLMESVLDLQQDGTALTGTLATHMFDLPLADGSVEGTVVSFSTAIEMSGRKMEIPFDGKVVDGKIELAVQPTGGMPPMTVLLRRATEEEVLARTGVVPERASGLT